MGRQALFIPLLILIFFSHISYAADDNSKLNISYDAFPPAITSGGKFISGSVNQSTKGSQSHIINAEKVSINNSNDEIRVYVTDKLSKIADKCNHQNVKLDDLKPEIKAIVAFKAKAVPYIIDFASSYIDLEIDTYDPNFLLNYRSRLTKTFLFDALFYTIEDIYKSDPEARSYLLNLYMKDLLPNKLKKDALFIGYYIWRLPPQDATNLYYKWLTDKPVSEFDPLRKVFLRAYLNQNINSIFILKPTIRENTNSQHREEGCSLDFLSGSGLEKMQNASTFLKHLWSYQYVSLEDLNSDINERRLILPDITKKLGNNRGVYLYGFDFYDIGVHNLRLDDILLGKAFFEKSIIKDIEINNSTILEGNFKNATISNGLFDDSRFIGTNFDKSIITWGGRMGLFGHSVISGCTFRESNMSNTLFVNVDIIDSFIEDCIFTSSKTTFRGGLLLNVIFKTCNPDTLVFENVIVDEQTLNNLSNLPGITKTNLVINEVKVNKQAFSDSYLKDNCFGSKQSFEDTTNCVANIRLMHELSTLQRHIKHYNRAKSIIKQQKLFNLCSTNVKSKESLEEKYAYYVSIIEYCKKEYPDEISDFETAKSSLDKLVESQNNFSGVLTNPTVPTLIENMKLKVVERIETPSEGRSICEKMKRGKFGIFAGEK